MSNFLKKSYLKELNSYEGVWLYAEAFDVVEVGSVKVIHNIIITQHWLVSCQLTFLPQHLADSSSTLCVASLHKHLQQIPVGGHVAIFLPPPQCLSPVLHIQHSNHTEQDVVYPLPLQDGLKWVHLLDVVGIHGSEFQVSGQLLLPVQHVVGNLAQVFLHLAMPPVQLQLQVGAGGGREG